MSSESRSPTLSTPPQQQLEGFRLLIVDDSPDNQVLMARILRKTGATVDVASNGEQAVAIASAQTFDAILMDVQMPVMDGFAATAALRARGVKTRIIALTAHTMKEERDRCLVGGFDDHVGKPVNWQNLVSMLLEPHGALHSSAMP